MTQKHRVGVFWHLARAVPLKIAACWCLAVEAFEQAGQVEYSASSQLVRVEGLVVAHS